VLVAAGCRGCFMYFMVPKSAGLCPKCGSSGLVHLGRSNNASYA
jgi:rRNA maturation endonuclease Nob1